MGRQARAAARAAGQAGSGAAGAQCAGSQEVRGVRWRSAAGTAAGRQR